MQTATILGWLLCGAALCACETEKTDTTPDKEPIQGETTQAALEVKQPTKPGEDYQLDTPKPTAAASAPAAGSPKTAPGPAAPAGDGAATLTKGPSVSGEGFEVVMTAGEVIAGKPATAQVVLSAVAPFHCNDKYPYKFTLDTTPGINYSETVIKKMQIGESRSTMSIPFTAAEAGDKTLSGELSFSVCTDDKCLIEKQKLSVKVPVKGKS